MKKQLDIQENLKKLISGTALIPLHSISAFNISWLTSAGRRRTSWWAILERNAGDFNNQRRGTETFESGTGTL